VFRDTGLSASRRFISVCDAQVSPRSSYLQTLLGAALEIELKQAELEEKRKQRLSTEQLERYKIDTEAELKRLELAETREQRLPTEKLSNDTNALKKRELYISEGRGIRFTTGTGDCGSSCSGTLERHSRRIYSVVVYSKRRGSKKCSLNFRLNKFVCKATCIWTSKNKKRQSCWNATNLKLH
jgi:hypothetical protein